MVKVLSKLGFANSGGWKIFDGYLSDIRIDGTCYNNRYGERIKIKWHYMGRQSGQIGNYIRCNTITPDGSTTTFALTNVLDNNDMCTGTENNVLCSISGVMRYLTAFTINNTNIVFSSGSNINGCC